MRIRPWVGGPAMAREDEFTAQRSTVERIRALPIRDMPDAGGGCHGQGRCSSPDAVAARRPSESRAGPGRWAEQARHLWANNGLVGPGDVDEVAAQALDFADHGSLAGLEIDRIERAAGDEPAVILVLAGRNDV